LDALEASAALVGLGVQAVLVALAVLVASDALEALAASAGSPGLLPAWVLVRLPDPIWPDGDPTQAP
jgi:hypothetical protein